MRPHRIGGAGTATPRLAYAASISAGSTMNAAFTVTWYSTIFPSRTTAVLCSTSTPVIWRKVLDARATACWAASLQLLSETPTSSMSRITPALLRALFWDSC